MHEATLIVELEDCADDIRYENHIFFFSRIPSVGERITAYGFGPTAHYVVTKVEWVLYNSGSPKANAKAFVHVKEYTQ